MNKHVYLFWDCIGFIKSHDLEFSVGFSPKNEFDKKNGIFLYGKYRDEKISENLKNTLDKIKLWIRHCPRQDQWS